MVNNSTNINKTNNYISPQIIEHTKKTTTNTYDPGPGLRQLQICDGFKPNNGFLCIGQLVYWIMY